VEAWAPVVVWGPAVVAWDRGVVAAWARPDRAVVTAQA